MDNSINKPKVSSSKTDDNPIDFSTLTNYEVADMATDPEVSEDQQKAAMAEYDYRENHGESVLDDLDDEAYNATHPEADDDDFNDDKYEEWNDMEDGLGRVGMKNAQFARPKPNRIHTSQESSPQSLKQAFDEANYRLDKHLDEYYIEGALDSLANGELRISPKDFITSSFVELEGPSLDRQVPFKRQQYFWNNFHDQSLDRSFQRLSPEAIRRLEKEALIDAVSNGTSDVKDSPSEPKSLHLSLPIFEHGDGALQNFMETYGASPNSQEVQLASYKGFINIAEAAASDNALRQQGLDALNWYYDNFHYQEHLGEFTAIIDGYAEEADQDFREFIDDYLASRSEIKHYRELEDKETTRQLNEFAESYIPVSPSELMAFIEDNIPRSNDSPIDIFPIVDETDRGPETGNTPNRSKSGPTAAEKCTVAKQKIEALMTLDPGITFYMGAIFRDGSQSRKRSKPYVVVRFGYNDYNNVIAIPIGEQRASMFCWRGQTGDNPEGWREYFQDTSIRNRDASVKRHICNGSTNNGMLAALDREWGRAAKDLDLELPSFVQKSAPTPISTPTVTTIPNQKIA